MARARKADPSWTPEDRAAGRAYRTKRAIGQLSSHAQETAEAARAKRLAQGKAIIEAAMVSGEKSLESQAKQRKEADALLLGRAAKISDEQIVELMFENFPISTEQAIERLARFDASAMRKAIKAK